MVDMEPKAIQQTAAAAAAPGAAGGGSGGMMDTYSASSSSSSSSSTLSHMRAGKSTKKTKTMMMKMKSSSITSRYLAGRPGARVPRQEAQQLPRQGQQQQQRRGRQRQRQCRPEQGAGIATDAAPSWCYDMDSSFWKQSGSANNWAYGYHRHGPQCSEDIRELARREVEMCDVFGGFLILQSLAGGTGSGLGALTTELLRDEYPSALLTNEVVWPYATGEVIVQNYNAMLTLAHLVEASDAMLVTQNDHVHDVCSRLLHIPRPSFDDLNGVIAGNLAHILLPCYSGRDVLMGDTAAWSPLSDSISHLCSHPLYRLTTLRVIPQMASDYQQFSSYDWGFLMKYLRQMEVTGSHLEELIDWRAESLCKSVASVLTLRGAGATRADWSMFDDESSMPMYADWTLDNLLVRWHESAAADCRGSGRSASAWSTSQSIVGPLDRLLGKSHDMFAEKAYVHHYAKHGVEEDEFIHCFAKLEQVLDAYVKI